MEQRLLSALRPRSSQCCVTREPQDGHSLKEEAQPFDWALDPAKPGGTV